jgi:DNA-binding transcriptional MerR regulator
MEETFFTTKQAAQITGCSLRQLQYWREKEVIVPTVNASGTGRSIYYSMSELVEMAILVYLLSVGLTFEVAAIALQSLKEQDPNYDKSNERWMLFWDNGDLGLERFERENAIALIDQGQAVIPLWLDRIYEKLDDKL